MNIYQRMMMQSLTAHGAAASVFGMRAPSAPAVPVTDVAALFKRGSLARSVINASTDMDYAMGQYGSGLNGLGSFAASMGKIPIIGAGTAHPVGFDEQWSYDDWTGASGWNDHIKFWDNIGASYTPLSSAVIQRAQSKWVDLQTTADAGSPDADTLVLRYEAQLRAAAAAVDVNTKAGNQYGQRSNGSHVERADRLGDVNKVLKAISNLTVPKIVVAQDEEIHSGGGGNTPGPGPGGGGGGGGGSISPPVVDPYAKLAKEFRIREADHQQQQEILANQNAATASGGGLPPWAMPAVVGVVFIGGAIFLMRKKK